MSNRITIIKYYRNKETLRPRTIPNKYCTILGET